MSTDSVSLLGSKHNLKGHSSAVCVPLGSFALLSIGDLACRKVSRLRLQIALLRPPCVCPHRRSTPTRPTIQFRSTGLLNDTLSLHKRQRREGGGIGPTYQRFPAQRL